MNTNKNKNTKIILCATLVASAALFGCSRETTSSANIKTPGLAPQITVTAENDTDSRVHVAMKIAGSSSNAYAVLEGGDRLVAEAGTDKKDMTLGDNAGDYEAEFGTAAAGTEFKVALERETEEDAINNRGILPAPFAIGALPDAKPSRATDDITVTWSPADTDTDMDIKVDGTCIFSKTFDAPGDSGTFVIPKGSLESTNKDMPADCDLTVTLTRSRAGSTDTIFDKESSFKLQQIRKDSFVSAP